MINNQMEEHIANILKQIIRGILGIGTGFHTAEKENPDNYIFLVEKIEEIGGGRWKQDYVFHTYSLHPMTVDSIFQGKECFSDLDSYGEEYSKTYCIKAVIAAETGEIIEGEKFLTNLALKSGVEASWRDWHEGDAMTF